MPIIPLSSWKTMWQWKTNLPVKSVGRVRTVTGPGRHLHRVLALDLAPLHVLRLRSTRSAPSAACSGDLELVHVDVERVPLVRRVVQRPLLDLVELHRWSTRSGSNTLPLMRNSCRSPRALAVDEPVAVVDLRLAQVLPSSVGSSPGAARRHVLAADGRVATSTVGFPPGTARTPATRAVVARRAAVDEHLPALTRPDSRSSCGLPAIVLPSLAST